MPGTGLPEDFSLNGFHFCREHGHELCNRCALDHRSWNDMMSPAVVEDVKRKLGQDFDFENRKPISVFNLGAVPSGTRRGNHGLFKCTEHNNVDCKTCFDWAKLIVAQEKKRDQGKVEDRDLLLRLLKSMNVEFPASANPPTEVLESKLKNALDHSQNIKSLATLPVKPESLPVWTDGPELSLVQAMGKVSFLESLQIARDRAQGRQPTGDDLYKNAFMDLRQTLATIAESYQSHGTRCWVLQDAESTHAIDIRALNVYKAGDGMAMIAVLYETAREGMPIDNTIGFVQNLVNQGFMHQITCTLDEQALLRKLLFLNSTRVSPEYKPEKKPFEKTFKTSLILPLGPIGLEGVGKLVRDGGCEVCGQRTTSRCSQCHMVSYCSPECQKIHWKTHKPQCRSLKGATWEPVKVTLTPTAADGTRLHVWTHGNQQALTPSATMVTEPDGTPPPNIHKTEPFIVKIQRLAGPSPLEVMRGASTGSGLMLVYDRQRSFKVWISEAQDPRGYNRLMQVMARISLKCVKMYFWARRTGEWELSVSFDKFPDPLPQW